MEEPICYLDDLTMTKVNKTTRMLLYFPKDCSSEAEPYLTYQRNHHSKTKE